MHTTDVLNAACSMECSMAQARAWSSLHQAVADGDVHLLQQLLSNQGGDEFLHSRDTYGWTPLHVAARLGHLPSLRRLLKDPRTDIEARDNTKCTALRHALGTGHNAAACELLMAGADARNGLLPFIMLDTYNRLMAHMEQTAAELEAELEPHQLLRHRLALLLHKHDINPQAGQCTQQRASIKHIGGDDCSKHGADQRCTDQDQRSGSVQQLCDENAKPSLKGVQRDAAEIEQAAQHIKHLQEELEPLRQCPVPPNMVHAIVSLVQASRDAGSADQLAAGDEQPAEQGAYTSSTDT